MKPGEEVSHTVWDEIDRPFRNQSPLRVELNILDPVRQRIRGPIKAQIRLRIIEYVDTI
jgi:hypothetical protein